MVALRIIRSPLTGHLQAIYYRLKMTVDLSGRDLSGVELVSEDLSDQDLSSTDLQRANLSGAILTNSDLSRANLES